MATIKITSPQAKGHARITVKGKPKLIMVNGYCGKVIHTLHMGPGKDSKEYWEFFLSERNGFITFIGAAKSYFGDKNYQDEPFYANGSSWFGGDKSGEDRKEKGYSFALQNLAAIIKGVGNEKIYFISHSEGCAYAAGMAKALIEKGYKVGESVMLSADEGDEFNVEGNYPCYQITAGRVITKHLTPSFLGTIYTPNSTNQAYGTNNPSVKREFQIDPIVKDHRISGVSRYGVYIDPYADLFTIHASTINKNIFRLIKELKTIKVLPCKVHGKIVYKIANKNTVWYKIDDKIVVNDNVDM